MVDVGALVERVSDRVDHVQRRVRPLGFTHAVFKRFGEDRGGDYTGLLTYYGFLSLLPLLVVLVTLLGRILEDDPELRQQILDAALANFPVLGDQLESNVSSLQTSGLVLAFGLLGALWGGLGVIQSAQDAMNTMWGVPRARWPNLFVRVGRSLLLLVVLGGALLVISVGGPLLSSISLPGIARVGTALLTVAVNTGVVLLAFHLLSVEAHRAGSLWPGALTGAVALWGLQMVGGLYVTRVVTNANDLYGVFAVVIGLFVWISLLARVLLLASEVNVVRLRRLWPRSLTGRNLGPPDRIAVELSVAREAFVPGQQVSTELPDDLLDPDVAPRADEPAAASADGDRAAGDGTPGGHSHEVAEA